MTNRDFGILVRKTDEEELERRCAEGYQRKPENPSGGKLGDKMAEEVWPEEKWDLAW